MPAAPLREAGIGLSAGVSYLRRFVRRAVAKCQCDLSREESLAASDLVIWSAPFEWSGWQGARGAQDVLLAFNFAPQRGGNGAGPFKTPTAAAAAGGPPGTIVPIRCNNQPFDCLGEDMSTSANARRHVRVEKMHHHFYD
jgi:hypothetical protein